MDNPETRIVEVNGRLYMVIFNHAGNPVEIKRQGASKHRLGRWVRIWHRRQGLAGRQSIVVAAILKTL